MTTPASRPGGRALLDLRPLRLTRHYLPYPEGSCLVELGATTVLVTATVESSVPPWMKGNGRGWVTAEYGMLPRATHTRNRRPGASPNGRSMEIQRLIGRALRAVVDLEKLGERSVLVDCDVLIADGGTRVASIIGAAVALHDAGTWLQEKGQVDGQFVRELVAAVSVGMLGDEVRVDLCYEEDSGADVDMNVVMTASGGLIEVQGTAEGAPYHRSDLDAMLDAARDAIASIVSIQNEALALP